MHDAQSQTDHLGVLIRARAVRVVFQPIVDLNDGMVIAYEALCRPAPESGIPNADALYSAAEACGLIWELETVTRAMSVEAARNWPRDVRLFLNVTPAVFSDDRFVATLRSDLAAATGLSPDRVVLELTERSDTVFSGPLLEQIRLAREAGFEIAIDDAGAGASGLNRMMLVRPGWIKLDRQIVAGLDRDSFKQNLVRFFVHFARMSGVSIVAEGVETAAELACLMGLGVRHAQGYYLARPGPRAETMDAQTISDIRERWAAVDAAIPAVPHELPMVRLLRPVLVADARTRLADAAAGLSTQSAQAGVVVTEGRRLAGWADRSSVASAAAGDPEGAVLGASRPVVCALAPESTVNEALQLVCAREDHDLTQPLVIASGPDILGVVPMRDLLRAAATDARPTSALRAPVTGLPSRVRADQHLEDLIARGADPAARAAPAFHADAAFIDVRRFADYNAIYGYEMGDRLIRVLGERIAAVVGRAGPDVFLAHLGDDRFLLTARADALEPRLRELMADFERLSPSLTETAATPADAVGNPLVDAASGVPMALRILLLPRVFERAAHPREVYRIEQQLRQKARNQEMAMAPGQSVLVVDRRGGPALAGRRAA
jgi:EAL domain-containing protein (putative c-di-GMP-specific phosphodiesterase class I)/GGDEF domain-containing protein